MTTNVYFNQIVQSEQNLYEDIIIESIRAYGQDLYYIPRTIVNKDPILFDDIPSLFSDAYKIEMYLENTDGFAGEGHLFSKFGIEIRDQATFVVSKRIWRNLVNARTDAITGSMPQEGDLIYLPLSKSLFQIMLVERESPFYQLSNLNVFRLECELFEYNDEMLNTGIGDIDVVETLGYETKLTLDADSDNDPFTPAIGDNTTQTLSSGVTITAKITDWDAVNQILSVAHISTSDGKQHNFTTGGVISYVNNSGTRIIRGVNEDFGKFGHQNNAFDSDVDPFLSFDENNPFGGPG